MYEPRQPQPLQDGYVFQFRAGNVIAVMSDDGDDLFSVNVDPDRTWESILKAALRAYNCGVGVGEVIGRGMLAGELRRLISAAEAGVGE